jgi:outer membrane biosynthesis protein TonB
MPTEKTYKRILDYLKGLLSDRERHELERDMMRDAFEEDAFEGLNQLSDQDLISDMDLLNSRLDSRVSSKEKKSLSIYFRIAAAFIILVGVGSILYFVLQTPSSDLLTQDKNIKSTVNEPESETLMEKKQGTNPTLPSESERAAAKPGKALPEPEKVSPPEQIIMQQSATATVSKKESADQSELSMEVAKDVSLQAKASEPVRKSGQMRKAPASGSAGKVVSGIVVDSNGDVLPGATIYEKGTTNGTMTDVNGHFELPLKDTTAILAVNFIGYKPVEIHASQKQKDKIVMNEEMTALNEVVVVGYGTQKKENITGSVSTIDFNDNPKPGAPDVSKPVPPGGSMRIFKKWINERLDYPSYEGLPGKYKVVVELTVHNDGSVGNISVLNDIPERIAADVKNVISKSPSWQPALNEKQVIEAKVQIRFVITVE